MGKLTRSVYSVSKKNLAILQETDYKKENDERKIADEEGQFLTLVT